MKINKCVYCGGDADFNEVYCDLGHGYSEMRYSISCKNCKASTKVDRKTTMLDIERDNTGQIKTAIGRWNDGNITVNTEFAIKFFKENIGEAHTKG